MTGRARLLTTIAHQEPDRVPISPRIQFAWLDPDGSEGLERDYDHLIDPMQILGDGTPNYIHEFPDEYPLEDVRVEQRRHREGEYEVVERVFHTPAGVLSDCTKFPPTGREYGMAPNPLIAEHLVKRPEDLDALRYLLPPVNADYGHLRKAQAAQGERGLVSVLVRSALDHNAGDARGMQNLMLDYYEDRPLFDRLVGLYHERSLQQVQAACEGGAEVIFGSWYYNSLSAGWSPAIFREVFVPQIREHVALAHRYGVLYDYYDDGKLAGSMEMIAETGIDVLETCTPAPVGDFDLRVAKERIGSQTTLKGYLDLLYVAKHGTPALVRDTVREAMDVAKPGGGFIIGSSDAFREGTPPHNMRAYFEACLEFGAY